jgi:hypothetical protein
MFKKGFLLNKLTLMLCASCLASQVAAQSSKPGLEGMAPSKWTSIKYTQSGGMIVSTGTQQMKSNFEDIYFKTWIPILNKKSFTLLAGPQYRSEQIEAENIQVSEDNFKQMCNWNLRFWGVDLRSIITRGENSWLALSVNVNQSGTLHDQSSYMPFGYTSSAVFIKRKSANKEIGYGGMINWSVNRLTVLPVFIFNYNFSSKSGIEISLPHKMAWRYNVSATDRLYLKSEATSRSYFVAGEDIAPFNFRRTDLSVGVSYNKQITRLIGVEAFGGYRKNIAHLLPEDITLVKPSGYTFSFEVYLRPPGKKGK